MDPTGYAGQLISPIYCGEPTKAYRDLHEVTVEVYHRAISALKPGNTSAIIDWINEPAIEAGYKNDITWHPWAIGHGGGPKFPLRAPPEEGIKLEKNMSVRVEPNIVTETGVMGNFMGTTCLVTENGGQSFNRYPAERLTVI